MHDEHRSAIAAEPQRPVLRIVLRTRAIQLQIDEIGRARTFAPPQLIHRLGLAVPHGNERLAMAHDIAARIGITGIALFFIRALFHPLGHLRQVPSPNPPSGTTKL